MSYPPSDASEFPLELYEVRDRVRCYLTAGLDASGLLGRHIDTLTAEERTLFLELLIVAARKTLSDMGARVPIELRESWFADGFTDRVEP